MKEGILSNKNGITLIALVVTIIVLLILAGVTIATLMGDNGILTRANSASAAQIEGQVNEEVKLAVQAAKMYAEEMSTKTATGWLASGNIGETSTQDYAEMTTEQKITVIGQMRADLTVEKGYNTITNNGDGTITVLYQTDEYRQATNDTNAKIEITITITGNTFVIGEAPITPPVTPSEPSEPESPKDPIIPQIITSADISNEPEKYFGVEVSNYVVNQSVADSDIKWKIFYADGETDEDGKAIAESDRHIYLIASAYIKIANAPSKTVGARTYSINYNTSRPYKGWFQDILGGYSTGSASITDSRIKALNNDYFNVANNGAGYSSTYDNMKSVAYMLDINTWNTYAMPGKAEYAIGGPTVELLFKSYNKRYGTQYKARAKSRVGYEISKDNGTTWANSYTEMLSTSDSLYVIDTNIDAESMWLASPSGDDRYQNEYVMRAYYYGKVAYNLCYDNYSGFRPIVCLKSGTQLEEQEDGIYIIKDI